MKNYKLIGGEHFWYRGTKTTWVDANVLAQKLRKEGRKARVVKHPKHEDYDVWATGGF